MKKKRSFILERLQQYGNLTYGIVHSAPSMEKTIWKQKLCLLFILLLCVGVKPFFMSNTYQENRPTSTYSKSDSSYSESLESTSTSKCTSTPISSSYSTTSGITTTHNNAPLPPSLSFSTAKSNKTLTPHEKKLKRELKKNIKAFHRINKLSKKIRHAQSRKDPIVEQKTRTELQKVLQEYKCKAEQLQKEDKDSFTKLYLGLPPDLYVDDNANHDDGDGMNHDVSSGRSPNEMEAQSIHKCKTILLSIYNHVIVQEREFSNEIRDKRNNPQSLPEGNDLAITRNLLQHMTKGTQSRDMFRNATALWGYTRQKFYSRAMLVVTSLLKLKDVPVPTENELYSEGKNDARMGRKEANSCDVDDVEKSCFALDTTFLKLGEASLWQNMKNVRSICSIGCGPGNDVAGFLSMIHHSNEKRNESTLIEPNNKAFHHTQIEEIVMLDYAMEDWNQVLHFIVNSCKVKTTSTLSPNCSIITDECDITQPLHSDAESQSFDPNSSILNDQTSTTHINATAAMYSKSVDIFLISYLLSETRALWDEFMMQLFDTAKRGSMFYFAEPTPWQLHRLMSLCDSRSTKSNDEMPNKNEEKKTEGNFAGSTKLEKVPTKMKFIWLDSSMNVPVLQGLHARLGPAVLFGIKL